MAKEEKIFFHKRKQNKMWKSVRSLEIGGNKWKHRNDCISCNNTGIMLSMEKITLHSLHFQRIYNLGKEFILCMYSLDALIDFLSLHFIRRAIGALKFLWSSLTLKCFIIHHWQFTQLRLNVWAFSLLSRLSLSLCPPHVHCYHIYNSQAMEATRVPIDR